MINIFKILILLCVFNSLSYKVSFSNIFLNSSYYMLQPYYWFRSELSKVYVPFHPGLYHQKASHVSELIHRSIILKKILIFAPASIFLGQFSYLPEMLYYYFRKNPFEFITGNIESKKFTDSSKFTLLNLNVCFLPGELPLFFGGVLPAAERVREIAQLLLEKDADVICLYEVHELTSASDLMNLLKDKYAYFYMNIGSNLFGMNSGLFIASKYQTSSPSFKPFHYLGKQKEINKGYFKFDLIADDKVIAKIYTTHLQPYQNKTDEEIRSSELNEIVQNMEIEYIEPCHCPILLCGDLNITWQPKNENLQLIKDHFCNAYAPKKSYIKNYTYSSYLTDYLWNNVHESSYFLEIIDYLLLFKKTKNFASIETEMVPMLNVHSPGNDLSDHNGLFSIITLN